MLKEIKNTSFHYFEDEQGRIQGEYKSWHYCNQVEIECFFVNGNMHGEYKSWWSNGLRRRHCFYVDNNLHGEFKLWHHNSQLSEHGFYVKGKLHGECKHCWENGVVYRHCFFVNGIQVHFSEIPYPETEEDRVLFLLKYDLQLLPSEITC